MELNKQELQELFDQENNITKIARVYCERHLIEYTDNIRRRVSNLVDKGEDADLENVTVTGTKGYEKPTTFMPSAWDSSLERFLTIEEYCDKYGLEKASVKSSKLISHVQCHMVYNIVFFSPEEESVLNLESELEAIIKNHIQPQEKRDSVNSYSEDWFDRLVFGDAHLGMNVQGKIGDPLYDGKWDREEILRRLDVMVEHVIRFQKSKLLIITELGDMCDGLGGQTTRKGHELPQNMNDKEVFELALEFKTYLVDTLSKYYDTIVCYDITNDNHSGVFSYFVSSAVKKILEQRYPNKVTVNTVKRFIEHHSVGNHTFIISHGKDVGEQKFGFKPKLDAVQAEKIDQYCKEHKLYNGNFIEFSKGDSHQGIYDDTTSNDFQYYNYPSFSPPSNWVKTNFKNSKSGFRFYNIHKEENIKIAIPYFF